MGNQFNPTTGTPGDQGGSASTNAFRPGRTGSVARGRSATSVSRAVRRTPIRVLMVATHSPGTDSLATALDQEGFEVRTNRPSSRQRLRTALEWQPDVVLVEFEENQPGNREVLAVATTVSSPVLVLAKDLTRSMRAQYATWGATRVLSARRTPKDIAHVIGEVLAIGETGPGRRNMAARTQWQIDREPDVDLALFRHLTAREREVLISLIDGMPAGLIALESSVSISTVRSQIRSILQKLGVNSQLRAVSMARRAGWPSAALPSRSATSSNQEVDPHSGRSANS
jgi:two-component system, NarL family, nitrate/nitrite response regulator NarL